MSAAKPVSADHLGHLARCAGSAFAGETDTPVREGSGKGINLRMILAMLAAAGALVLYMLP